MAPYQYTISLRIWHPSMPHEEILEAISRPATSCWTAGDPRFSPKGKPLGRAKTTYLTTALTADSVLSDPVEVEHALQAQVDDLTPLTAFFKKIRDEGGKAELFVGLFSPNNLVIEIEPSLMAKFAKCELSICLDYYPWERFA